MNFISESGLRKKKYTSFIKSVYIFFVGFACISFIGFELLEKELRNICLHFFYKIGLYFLRRICMYFFYRIWIIRKGVAQYLFAFTWPVPHFLLQLTNILIETAEFANIIQTACIWDKIYLVLNDIKKATWNIDLNTTLTKNWLVWSFEALW